MTIRPRRLFRTTLLSWMLSVMMISSSIAGQDAWRDWQSLLHQACPGHHVDWVCDGCGLQLVEAFEDTLSERVQRQIARIADIDHACAQEQIGFYCDRARHLVAFERLGLMHRFVVFGCKTVKCEEAAICSRLPDHAL